MMPLSPTAHTSLAPLPQTAYSATGVGLATCAHALPFQCRRVPPSPTAQTSLLLLPHTPCRSFIDPLASTVQAMPFQRRRVPWAPTIHRSDAEVPQLLYRAGCDPSEPAQQRTPLPHGAGGCSVGSISSGLPAGRESPGGVATPAAAGPTESPAAPQPAVRQRTTDIHVQRTSAFPANLGLAFMLRSLGLSTSRPAVGDRTFRSPPASVVRDNRRSAPV